MSAKELMQKTQSRSPVRLSVQPLSSRDFRRRGVALIWSAIIVLAMILMAGLSLDVGKLVLNNQQLHSAADAAALAGALYVKTELPSVTRANARLVGLENATEGLPVSLRTDPEPQADPFPAAGDGSYDYSNYDIVVGRWIRSMYTQQGEEIPGYFVPTTNGPNAVMVIARRDTALAEMDAPPLRFLWGPIVGVETANARKISVGLNNSSNGAGLIVLSPEPTQTLNFDGGPIVNIDNGGIHINSTSTATSSNTAGAGVSNNSVIDAGFFNVVGTVSPAPESDAWLSIFNNTETDQQSGEVHESGTFTIMDHSDGIQHINDPLAAAMLDTENNTADEQAYVEAHYANEPEYGPGARLDLPALLAAGLPFDDRPTVDSSATLSPGYYPNGLTLSTGDNVELIPNPSLGFLGNVFIFGGGQDSPNHNVGLSMNGGTLTGHGVTCYVTETCDNLGVPISTPVYGVVKITGGTLDLQSPGDFWNEGVEGLNGITIWQDPAMPLAANDAAQLNGEGNFNISGTIYFPDPLEAFLSGNLGDTGNQILVGKATISGDATITVNYDGRNEGYGPARVCLVH